MRSVAPLPHTATLQRSEGSLSLSLSLSIPLLNPPLRAQTYSHPTYYQHQARKLPPLLLWKMTFPLTVNARCLWNGRSHRYRSSNTHNILTPLVKHHKWRDSLLCMGFRPVACGHAKQALWEARSASDPYTQTGDCIIIPSHHKKFHYWLHSVMIMMMCSVVDNQVFIICDWPSVDWKSFSFKASLFIQIIITSWLFCMVSHLNKLPENVLRCIITGYEITYHNKRYLQPNPSPLDHTTVL